MNSVDLKTACAEEVAKSKLKLAIVKLDIPNLTVAGYFKLFLDDNASYSLSKYVFAWNFDFSYS